MIATVLILVSAVVFAATVWRELDPGAPPPNPDVRRLPPVLLIAINGVLFLAALAVLAGIWIGR